MTWYDGWYFGVGFALALIVIRLPLALFLWALEAWLQRLRDRQVDLHHKLRNIERAMKAIERTMGRDPEAR